MAIARFIMVFCFVVMVAVVVLGFCVSMGSLVWMRLKDAITDWKQYRLKR